MFLGNWTGASHRASLMEPLLLSLVFVLELLPSVGTDFYLNEFCRKA